MEAKIKTALLYGAVALGGYMVYTKYIKKGDSTETATKAPSGGGGGGGGGFAPSGTKSMESMPITLPTLNTPTTNITVNPPVATQTAVSSSVPPSRGTVTPTPPPPAPVNAPVATSTATNSSAPRFSNFSYVDGNQKGMLDSLL